MPYNEVTSKKMGGKKNSKGGNSEGAGISQKNWPDTLETFIGDCFTKSYNLNEGDKLIFQQQLNELLTKAEAEQKLWTNDWARQELPIFSPGTSLQLCSDSAKRPRKEKGSNEKDYDSEERKRQRMERFNSPKPELPTSLPPKPLDSSAPVIGRNQTLEKSYYRLTSEPDPNMVRPQNVLQKAVKSLLEKLNDKPYSYIKDQFKAIRQDMTVQHIKNDFAMYIYETNTRIAIDNNDLGEFNQCVSQLEYFFEKKTIRNSHLNRTELEFICYRVLYYLIVENHAEIFKIKLKLNTRTFNAPDELEKLEFVNLSFELQNLMLTSNYYSFFKVIDQLKPLKHAYHLITNYLLEKQRVKTVVIIGKSYRILSVDQIITILKLDRSEFAKFCKKFKLLQFVKDDNFDCVGARPALTRLMATTNFKKIDIKGQV